MSEPFQVFSFGMAVPDLKIVGQSQPEEHEQPLPVVITPTEKEAEQAQPVEVVEPEIEVRAGVAKAPKRRQESSEQRNKP